MQVNAFDAVAVAVTAGARPSGGLDSVECSPRLYYAVRQGGGQIAQDSHCSLTPAGAPDKAFLSSTRKRTAQQRPAAATPWPLALGVDVEHMKRSAPLGAKGCVVMPVDFHELRGMLESRVDGDDGCASRTMTVAGGRVCQTQATAFSWVAHPWETVGRCGKSTSAAQCSPGGACVAVHSAMLHVGRHCRCTAGALGSGRPPPRHRIPFPSAHIVRATLACRRDVRGGNDAVKRVS